MQSGPAFCVISSDHNWVPYLWGSTVYLPMYTNIQSLNLNPLGIQLINIFQSTTWLVFDQHKSVSHDMQKWTDVTVQMRARGGRGLQCLHHRRESRVEFQCVRDAAVCVCVCACVCVCVCVWTARDGFTAGLALRPRRKRPFTAPTDTPSHVQ